MTDDDLRALFLSIRTIAVVGLSKHADRASHPIAFYLRSLGYRIFPVNPTAVGQRIVGRTVYPDLASLPEKVDLVQVFRKPEDVPLVVREAVAMGARFVWLQLGIANPGAADEAAAAGIQMVMNKCMLEEHLRLFGKPFVEKPFGSTRS
jgi:uncharacterized protein